MNAMCTFVYLFIICFSFAPVISASIHRYVNYFDIQILIMVTETEMLMSTLHHNKFTYLDYVFLLPSYIYIYIYACLIFDYKYNNHFGIFIADTNRSCKLLLHISVSPRYICSYSFNPSTMSRMWHKASIHHYVKYSDIQVLMIFTEIKTFNVDFTS